MKCFNHNEIDATGQCKHCYKGLCSDCVTDLGHGLACKNMHETEVEGINDLISNSAKSYSSSKNSVFLSNLYLLLMGALFIWFGIEKSKFLIAFGVMCILYWLLLLIYNTNLFKKIKTDIKT